MPNYLTPAEARQDSNAGWAQTFKGGSTNLSQRQRYNADIAQGSINEDKRDAAAGEAALATNKGLRDLVFGRANQRLARDKQDLAEERLNFEKKKRVFDEDFKIEDERLKRRSMEISMDDKLRDADIAKMVLDHTNALKEDVHTLVTGGQVEGTPAFAKAVIASVLRNPNADKDVVNNLFKAARIQGDPEVIKTQALHYGLEPSGARLDPQSGELVATFSRPRVQSGSSASGTSSPSKPNPNIARVEKLRDELTNLDPKRDKAKYDAKQQRIEYLQNEMKGPASSMGDLRMDERSLSDAPSQEITPSQATAATQAPSSASKPKKVIQNGITYELGPDGNYH